MQQYRTQKAGLEIRKTYDKLLAMWGVETTEYDIPTRYGTTHIIAAGKQTNPPVVLFHGVGDDSALMWIYNAAALAEDYRVYAVDTIGGPGKSEMGAGYGSDFDDVLWIDDTLDGLLISKAALIGVSHGGYLAQLYTLRRGERAPRAICISSAVPTGEGSPMKTMMKIFMPEALLPTDKNVRKLLVKLSGEHAEAFLDNPAILAHYGWLLKGFNNMAMGMHKVTSFKEAEIDALRDRAFYLAGDKDPFMQLGGKNAILRHNMRARFYQDAGHGLNHELSETINRALSELLSAESLPKA